MAVKKFTSRQNPNTQLDLRLCPSSGCEALSEVLTVDLLSPPFSRSVMLQVTVLSIVLTLADTSMLIAAVCTEADR